MSAPGASPAPRVTYLVAAHHSPGVVRGLVDALAPNDVLLHLDAKVDAAPFLAALQGAPHVELLQERVDVRWGGWSQVQTAMLLMRRSLERRPDDRAVLLSGDSYPLAPQSEIRSFLERDGGEYLSCVALPVPGAERLKVREFGSLTRLSRVRLETAGRRPRAAFASIVNRLELRRPYRHSLGGREPYAGGQWWTLSAPVMGWLLHELHRDPGFARLSRTMSVPDEFTFPTLLMNSPFADAVRPSLMYTDWSRDTGWSPAWLGPEQVEILARGIATPAVRDVDFLARHALQGDHRDRPLLFARKVRDTAIQQAIRQEVWPGAAERLSYPDRRVPPTPL